MKDNEDYLISQQYLCNERTITVYRDKLSNIHCTVQSIGHEILTQEAQVCGLKDLSILKTFTSVKIAYGTILFSHPRLNDFMQLYIKFILSDLNE